MPADNTAPDFDSERRTGDSLYTDSVIAIDAATGRILGYNQLVKRDSHDWDVDSPPTQATTRSGKRIVASANKDGLLSILDRSRVTPGRNATRSHGCPPAPVADAYDDPRERERAAFAGSRGALLSGHSRWRRVKRRRVQPG